MSTITLATNRNDIICDALSDEAQSMLDTGVTLDHIFAILPEAVSTERFLGLLYSRVIDWVMNNLEDNQYLDPDNSRQPYMIGMDAYMALQASVDAFWDNVDSRDYARLNFENASPYNYFQADLSYLINNSMLKDHIDHDMRSFVTSLAANTFRLCPQFDSEPSIVANRGSLIDLWNELA
jgi:hypothetical protein